MEKQVIKELIDALEDLINWQLLVGGEQTGRNSQVIQARAAILKARQL